MPTIIHKKPAFVSPPQTEAQMKDNYFLCATSLREGRAFRSNLLLRSRAAALLHGKSISASIPSAAQRQRIKPPTQRSCGSNEVATAARAEVPPIPSANASKARTAAAEDKTAQTKYSVRAVCVGRCFAASGVKYRG
jgi:hypothetical protein